MSTTVTIVVYAVLLALLAVLYWLISKRDLFGTRANREGHSRGLRLFGVSMTPPQPQRPIASRMGDTVKPAGAATSEAAEAVAVLEDMYREFTEQVNALRTEWKTWQNQFEVAQADSQSQWQARLNQLERQVANETRSTEAAFPVATAAPAPARASSGESQALTGSASVEPTVESFDTRYLEVFDLIQQGRDAQAIAADLGVEIADVERVMRVMTGPAQDLQ